MKRLLSLILAMMSIVLPSVAHEISSEDSTKPITLETTTQNNSDGSDRHRAPIRINIEAYYSPGSQSIDILYCGEATGEVYLYLNDTIIGYDTEINTSFQVSAHGLYKLEIIGATWIAEGYIQL